MTRGSQLSKRGLVVPGAILVGACLGIFLYVYLSSAPPVVSVFPIPGGQVASPNTQIAFRGLPVDQLGKIVVTGSRSGRHAGRLRADSDGRGGSFLPIKPFAPGEMVTVRTDLTVLNARNGAFHFRVANPAGSIPLSGLPPAPRVPGDVLTFRSRPQLDPAAVEISKRSPVAAQDDIFLTPQQGPFQNGLMIISPGGELVWFEPLPKGDMAANLSVQHYLGKRVLTWWQGYSGAGLGIGEDVIDSSSYRRVAVVHAANGLSADLHEFELAPRGTALITAYYPVYWKLSPRGRGPAIVLDSVVQDIDVKTGLVLFQWDSLDHVPVNDSYEPVPASTGQPYDYFHINSIQRERDGDLILSARNTWAVYEVSSRTGQTIWTLGGKRSSFRLGKGASFAFQHDVRVHSPDGPTVTVFDDGAGPPAVHQQSRGLTLRLDAKRKTATLVKRVQHSPPLLSDFEGDLEPLDGGDQFVGWGQQPYFTEFNSSGQIVFDGRFVDDNSSYRAYRFRWSATPATIPAIAASTSGRDTTIYASWNGATTVTSWRVLAGSSPSKLLVASTSPKRGFETQITIPAAAYVAVQALDEHRRVLGQSTTVRAS